MPYRASIKSSKTGRKAYTPKRHVPKTRTRQFTRMAAATTVARQGGQVSAFANQQRVTLNYCEVVKITTTGTGLGGEVKFRANSIFDPNYSVGGHQPMGHDEWQAAYQHYRVVGSTISANVAPSSAVVDPMVFYVELSSTSAVSIDASTAIERGRAAYKIMANDGDTPAKPLINSYDAVKFFGSQAAGGDANKAQFGANPAEDVYFNVAVDPMSTGSTIRDFFVLVNIKYDCILTEPVPLTQS